MPGTQLCPLGTGPRASFPNLCLSGFLRDLPGVRADGEMSTPVSHSLCGSEDPAPPDSGDTSHTLSSHALSPLASALLSALWALLYQAAPCCLLFPTGASPGLAGLSHSGRSLGPGVRPWSICCRHHVPKPANSPPRNPLSARQGFPPSPWRKWGARGGAGPECAELDGRLFC